MATDIAGVVFGGIFGVIFVVSCLASVVKACKDRRKIKERIATRQANPCVVTTSTSAESMERPRSASNCGELTSPEIFNYRRSSYGSGVIVRSIGEDGYDVYEAAGKSAATISRNYALNTHVDGVHVRGSNYLENTNRGTKYYQRRRSYEEAITNASQLYFPPQKERRLTEPNPRYVRDGRAKHERGTRGKERGPDARSNHYEMNGRGGNENKAFDRVEETHHF